MNNRLLYKDKKSRYNNQSMYCHVVFSHFYVVVVGVIDQRQFVINIHSHVCTFTQNFHDGGRLFGIPDLILLLSSI
jgi:hypothetical protein